VIRVTGEAVGRVNGLAVIQQTNTGLILPIEASVTPSMTKQGGKIIATGKLGEIAKEAVSNVSAIIKAYSGKDVSDFDIHIQFLQAYEGVEGDSASVSVATAVISALEKIPIRQDVAMTGSLSIRGEVLPIGGVNAKIEAAIQAGIKEVIIPEMNAKDVLLKQEEKKKIQITPVTSLSEVIQRAFKWKKFNKNVLRKIKKVA